MKKQNNKRGRCNICLLDKDHLWWCPYDSRLPSIAKPILTKEKREILLSGR